MYRGCQNRLADDMLLHQPDQPITQGMLCSPPMAAPLEDFELKEEGVAMREEGAAGKGEGAGCVADPAFTGEGTQLLVTISTSGDTDKGPGSKLLKFPCMHMSELDEGTYDSSGRCVGPEIVLVGGTERCGGSAGRGVGAGSPAQQWLGLMLKRIA